MVNQIIPVSFVGEDQRTTFFSFIEQKRRFEKNVDLESVLFTIDCITNALNTNQIYE